MTIESANRGAFAGRLFNRAPIPQGKRCNDPYDRAWFDQEMPSGGGFSPSFELHKNPKSVLTKIPEGDETRREKRIDDESYWKNKKRHFEDDRERVEDDLDRKEEDSPIEDNESIQSKKNPVPTPLLQLPTFDEKKKSQSKTGLTTITSAMSKGKRQRQFQNKVAFSGEQILLEKSHQTDVVLQCQFVDLVKVLYISHFSEYSKEVYDSLWYTRDEIDELKKDYFYWKRMSRRGEQRASVERKISSEGRSHNLRHHRHKTTTATVLREQERQRNLCHQIYGRIVNSSGNLRSGSCIIDRERLKEVYRRAGKTMKRQQEAIERASPDFHLQVYYSRIQSANVEDQQEANGSIPNIYKQHDEQQHHQEPEWSSMEESYSRCCMPISESFQDSIGCVFFTLLTPWFLEQPRGPSLFLDIGEEMILAA